MTFDPKSLLTAPLPPDLTVDGLAVVLKRLSEIGMGGAVVCLPDSQPINTVELKALGETPAHFILRRKS